MQTKPELIIVFKKNVSDEEAEKLMKSFGSSYRKGMDSSKGKIYFYNTGPKYILTFETPEKKSDFKTNYYHFLPEIHQIYEPNWDIHKD